MPINTASIAALLRPGLAEVFGDYPMYPAQWKEIFDVHTSDKAVEVDVEIKMLGLAQLRAEGAGTFYDTMQQTYLTNYINRYVSIGFIITRQAIKDNLYKSRFPMQAKALKDSFNQTEEVLGAAVINNGFDTNYPIGDGQPLFSTAHPIVGGTVANTFTVQADLNEASLEDAIVAIQQFKNQAGLIVMTKPQKLLVPPQLQWTANRLLESSFRVGTANNDVNSLNNTSAIPQGYRVNQFFTDPSQWTIKTDAPSGFKKYDREALEIDMYTDFDNDNLKVKGITRYSFGVSNFRCAFGSQGAS